MLGGIGRAKRLQHVEPSPVPPMVSSPPTQDGPGKQTLRQIERMRSMAKPFRTDYKSRDYTSVS